MGSQSGALRHGYNVGRIVVLFTVYVVALSVGTVYKAFARGIGRLRSAGSRLLGRTGPEANPAHDSKQA
jgi:hypothetical protein